MAFPSIDIDFHCLSTLLFRGSCARLSLFLKFSLEFPVNLRLACDFITKHDVIA